MKKLFKSKAFRHHASIIVLHLAAAAVFLCLMTSLPFKLYSYNKCTAELRNGEKLYKVLTEDETDELIAAMKEADISLFGYIDKDPDMGKYSGPAYIITLKNGKTVTVEPSSNEVRINGRTFNCSNFALAELYIADCNEATETDN